MECETLNSWKYLFDDWLIIIDYRAQTFATHPEWWLTYFSLAVWGTLFLRRMTDASMLPTDAALLMVFELDWLWFEGGLMISFIFGFTVVEKLRPRAIEPKIKLKSSAFGLTGAGCWLVCNLLPIINEFRGDSTSFGSKKKVKFHHSWTHFYDCRIISLPIARRKRTSSFAKSHFSSSSAVSNKIVANCLLTDDGSRF